MNRVYQSADECDDSTKRKNDIRFAARSQQFGLMPARLSESFNLTVTDEEKDGS